MVFILGGSFSIGMSVSLVIDSFSREESPSSSFGYADLKSLASLDFVSSM
jgi:hypothetical protein